MTVAAESLIAQLHSQSKHTTPRRENRKKFYTKTQLKKKKDPLRSIYLHQKHTPKSRETIPLTLILTASYP
jgi:hypothetical protein